jgi:hypothetical protein
LHLAPKKFSDFSDVDAATAKFLKAKAQDNKNMRRREGFLPEGETNTDYGQRIESLTDAAAYPEQVGDLTLNRVPPSMRDLLATNPEARVMDFAPDIGGILKLPELRNKMLEIRALGPKAEYSAYGQAPAKVPDEFLLPDDTLAKLNVAAAQRPAPKTQPNQSNADNAPEFPSNLSSTAKPLSPKKPPQKPPQNTDVQYQCSCHKDTRIAPNFWELQVKNARPERNKAGRLFRLSRVVRRARGGCSGQAVAPKVALPAHAACPLPFARYPALSGPQAPSIF